MGAKSEAAHLAAIVSKNAYDGGGGNMPDNQYDEMCNGIAAIIVSAGYVKHRVITTAAELDACNLDAVVVDRGGCPRTKRHGDSHMGGGWTNAGRSPLKSSELADGHKMTVVFEGRRTT